MRRWLLPMLAVGVVIAVGVRLWLPPGEEPDRYSDLGTALIGGAVVALAILLIQERLSRTAEKRDLQLQLGLADSFPGIDLKHRDLSGLYIPGKDLRQANLTEADLRGANLSGVDLQHAILNGADLRGAKLDKTPLYPSRGLKPAKGLKPGPIHKDANTQGTSFYGAKYDSKTKCPPGLDLNERGAIRVNNKKLARIKSGRRFFGF